MGIGAGLGNQAALQQATAATAATAAQTAAARATGPLTANMQVPFGGGGSTILTSGLKQLLGD